MTLVLFFVREINEKLCQDCLGKTVFCTEGEGLKTPLCCESEAPEGSSVAGAGSTLGTSLCCPQLPPLNKSNHCLQEDVALTSLIGQS